MLVLRPTRALGDCRKTFRTRMTLGPFYFQVSFPRSLSIRDGGVSLLAVAGHTLSRYSR